MTPHIKLHSYSYKKCIRKCDIKEKCFKDLLFILLSYTSILPECIYEAEIQFTKTSQMLQLTNNKGRISWNLFLFEHDAATM